MQIASLTKEQLFEEIKKLLVTRFELPESKVVPEAQIYKELDLDSIDAVDILVQLQKLTGVKVKPEDFKQVRTVQDMVDAAHSIVQSIK